MVTLSFLYLREQQVPEISREPKESQLLQKSSLSLIWYNTLGKQSGIIPMLSELSISNGQKKSSTSQEQIQVWSELNNLCKSLAFP